jgi:N-acetylmuramoyl-L-alanine amidase
LQIVQRLGRSKSIEIIALLLAAVAIPIGAAQTQSPAPAPAPEQQQPPSTSPQQTSPTSPAPIAPPQRPAFVVILDPGHGGADNGARGASGVVEKDVALALAKATRGQLQQQGLRVLLTRESDEDPSFDERATLANAQRSALLVSFHVSSTGKVGSVRTYYYTFAPVTAAAANPAGSPAAAPRAASHLIPWDRAQENFAEGSHRLADLIQAELVKNFPGSPGQSSAVPLRDLRSVAAPAVSVELSSVTVADRGALEAMYTPLAASIARGIVAFHSTSASNAGGH